MSLCTQGGAKGSKQLERRKGEAGKEVHCFALRITTLEYQITDNVQTPNNLVS